MSATGPTTDSSTGAAIIVEEDQGSFLCIPAGAGPFPGVLYNHGGLGEMVGGDLEGTCRALAEAGVVGHAKKRRETTPLTGHIDDVFEGLNTLLVRPEVDADRIGLLGFSRGGLLSLQAAKMMPEVFDAIVLMAPAPAMDLLATELQDVSPLVAPVLVLVAENDLYMADHVTLAMDVVAALEATGKEVQFILYPPFGSDGHTFFFTVNTYWADILTFLAPRLG